MFGKRDGDDRLGIAMLAGLAAQRLAERCKVLERKMNRKLPRYLAKTHHVQLRVRVGEIGTDLFAPPKPRPTVYDLFKRLYLPSWVPLYDLDAHLKKVDADCGSRAGRRAAKAVDAALLEELSAIITISGAPRWRDGYMLGIYDETPHGPAIKIALAQNALDPIPTYAGLLTALREQGLLDPSAS